MLQQIIIKLRLISFKFEICFFKSADLEKYCCKIGSLPWTIFPETQIKTARETTVSVSVGQISEKETEKSQF